MIELKKVSKTYKSKKSTNTVALKNISIKFPEKGMVFILGKSGSGKSTLLNIIGGLDKYDDGDIIINGKSTQKFKEKDFDAFRNTYMGFIFQEYNLLDNYSIEQNIKLALELQHQKATNEEVQKALKQVGLENIEKRKTNELSGGQKQRVAMARALVKNPEIILADEPTGNLDSNTSEQVWEILKKLSEEKLVIVVSHDVESAEKYADRIIKIADGEIIEDKGNQEVTETNSYKVKNAKLPFYYSFKMAMGSLVHKKIRLIFSTVLILFSLVCFGLMLSAYKNDLNDETIRIFEKNGPTEVTISKYKVPINFIEVMEEQRKADMENNNDKLQELMEKYQPVEIDDSFKKEVEKNTGLKWKALYTIDTPEGLAVMVYSTSLQNQENIPVYYYIGSNNMNLTFVDSEHIDTSKLTGRVPQAEDETVISSYLADCIIYRGCMAKTVNDDKTEETKYEPKSYEQILNDGRYVNFCNTKYLKIVGIIDDWNVLKEYEEYKNVKLAELQQKSDIDEAYNKYYKFSKEIVNNESRVFVNKIFIDNLKNKKGNISEKTSKISYDSTNLYINTLGYINKSTEIITDNGIKNITEINDNEIVINEALLDMITNYNYGSLYELNGNKYESRKEFLIQYIKDNKNLIGKVIKSNVNNGKIVNNENEYVEYKIIGVVLDEMERSSNYLIYYSKNVAEPLMTSSIHCTQISRKVDTVDEMKTILKYYPVEGSTELSQSEYSNMAGDAATMSYFIRYIAKYGVVFFLVFSAIILMTFINSSIRFRKKEIGTLRALGCRSKDIIIMFLYESVILMLIALGISFVIIPQLISAINSFMTTYLFVQISIFKFGIVQMLEMTGIMLAIVLLGNIIPVRRITKMKPIDAILNK